MQILFTVFDIRGVVPFLSIPATPIPMAVQLASHSQVTLKLLGNHPLHYRAKHEIVDSACRHMSA